MGRLFWKFFTFIALAQIGAMLAIGMVFWLTDTHLGNAAAQIDSGPSAGTKVSAAAALLRYGGLAAFQEWTAREPRQAVYAIDETGSEALGRPVAESLVAQARELHSAQSNSPEVIESAPAGAAHRYLVFAARDAALAPGGARAPPPGSPPGPRFRGLPPVAPMVATLLASLLTAGLIARYVAKPVRSLRFAFDAASAGDLSQRVAPLIGARQDELADLGREFDRMAERLRMSMDAQRRLLHDISHEVRSPLARLQAAVGLLRQKYAAEDLTIDRIEGEIARIDQLIGDLLKLSRIEAGELVEDIEEIDLRELVSQVVSDSDFEARSVGRAVSWTSSGAGVVRGRPEMLHVAFENVLRNALKHAPQCPMVEIDTRTDTAAAMFSFRVRDTGPGVPDQELKELFTPFFRSTGANSSRDGYGLGLAIARRCVQAHGGTVDARNRPSGGLEVEILLPLN